MQQSSNFVQVNNVNNNHHHNKPRRQLKSPHNIITTKPVFHRWMQPVVALPTTTAANHMPVLTSHDTIHIPRLTLGPVSAADQFVMVKIVVQCQLVNQNCCCAVSQEPKMHAKLYNKLFAVNCLTRKLLLHDRKHTCQYTNP